MASVPILLFRLHLLLLLGVRLDVAPHVNRFATGPGVCQLATVCRFSNDSKSL
jgi:hypothetical protein